ncbi:hypothetical protein CGI03_23685 [Vibrio parahaemolyticus]|uniref:DUF6602 domain-containing protein n=4 Tax=Vibrio parahaemolyticus TaxID=670 RepID=UPI0004057BEA|nr:DUF6602 domain-containing protein [Vibrio parahaemolyticus]EIF8963316.1 hypothetical protein [Vibrio parahaemolyticus]EIO4088965.1 hypothetical protein [Vibrio parahaemolyticus]TOL12764.1 hypothetical protein CGI03_23685 [Vibrio parahaemolyticus]HCE4735503.1 hypothetical protein [Vibrio parahaemolyticus]HCG9872161.1 hypothetical protein [Vibrio parahaemolyticus]
MSTLMDLLEIESNDLDSKFRKASIEGKGCPDEISDRRESALKEVMAKYFPFPFRIAKGIINDSDNKRSASIDCLVLNPEHPYTVSEDERFSIILAEGVDFAIELKPDISDEKELKRGLKQIESVKTLTKKHTGTLDLTNSNSEKMKETLTKIPSFIFSNNSFEKTRTICNHIVSYYESHGMSRVNQFDAIVINGKGILFNSRKDSYFYIGDNYNGLYFIPFGSKTLAAFLFQLSTLPLSSPRMTDSVLSHYNDLNNMKTESFSDLNNRLLSLG